MTQKLLTQFAILSSASNTTFTSPVSPQFGQITSRANFSRLIQLGVRFFL